MSQLLAVDLVLIPDEALQEKVIDLNRSLTHCSAGGIQFEDDLIPHISVWMGVVERSELEGLQNFILAQRQERIELSEFVNHQTQSGGFLAHWNLSEACEKSIKEKYLSHSRPWEKKGERAAHQKHFAEKCSQKTVSYVNDYNLERARLHITIGHGQVEHEKAQFTGKGRWRLFQLGDHCTCRSRFCLF